MFWGRGNMLKDSERQEPDGMGWGINVRWVIKGSISRQLEHLDQATRQWVKNIRELFFNFKMDNDSKSVNWLKESTDERRDW